VKASFLCGVHYEGLLAHQHEGWPAPPELYDSSIGQQTFDHFLEYAALADQLGFDWISISEHHYSPHILTPSLAAIGGALSQVVKKARIASLGPLVPVNNPVRLAEEIAMLDVLTHGRLNVLPLRGTPNEYNVYGTVTTEKSRAMTHEAILLIRKALTETTPFSWEGEHFQFPRIAIWPRPVQQPTPPMFSSGNNLDSATFAGANRLGMCTSFLPPPAVALTTEAYNEQAASAGWQPTADQIVHRNHIVVAESAAEAAELERNFLPTLLRNNIARNIGANRVGTGIDALMAAWAERLQAGHLAFAGTPDMLVEQIREFAEQTGVGVLDFIFTGGQTPPAAVRRSLELFGREVLPRIRAFGKAAPPTSARTAAAVGDD
jgi:alkanesulfonate monooxygenase SsuD/methylene tetrahydromethanopterin reductase-like flavin-dependent oxidoreductase (luciferase family)